MMMMMMIIIIIIIIIMFKQECAKDDCRLYVFCSEILVGPFLRTASASTNRHKQ